jgi:hypothetical protein
MKLSCKQLQTPWQSWEHCKLHGNLESIEILNASVWLCWRKEQFSLPVFFFTACVHTAFTLILFHCLLSHCVYTRSFSLPAFTLRFHSFFFTACVLTTCIALLCSFSKATLKSKKGSCPLQHVRPFFCCKLFVSKPLRFTCRVCDVGTHLRSP